MTPQEPRLGVDIGRVIIDGSSPDGGDTSFFRGGLDNALHTPPVNGVFEALTVLVQRFDGRVWLVSKCQERVELRTKAWLEHHEVFDRTGLSADHLRFCRRRSEKAPICAGLGITHFIDDRVDVLAPMRGVVEHRYLFGTELRPGDDPRLTPAPDWATALDLIQPDRWTRTQSKFAVNRNEPAGPAS